MPRIVVRSLGVMLCLGILPGFGAEESATQIHQRLTMAFEQADADRDQKLTIDEFLVGRTNVPVAKRDFRLVDFDDDQHLSLSEFLTAPVVVDARHRGPLPDIMTGLVDQICIALDAACDDWQRDPQRELNARQFVLALSAQF